MVAYINEIIIARKGSIKNHTSEVGNVFDLVLENQMIVEIIKCVIQLTEASFIEFIMSGRNIRMDPAKAQDVVDWPRPTNQKQVEEILGLWNVYRPFISNDAQIVGPIMDLLK